MSTRDVIDDVVEARAQRKGRNTWPSRRKAMQMHEEKIEEREIARLEDELRALNGEPNPLVFGEDLDD